MYTCTETPDFFWMTDALRSLSRPLGATPIATVHGQSLEMCEECPCIQVQSMVAG